jgi:hypothetical protein
MSISLIEQMHTTMNGHWESLAQLLHTEVDDIRQAADKAVPVLVGSLVQGFSDDERRAKLLAAVETADLSVPGQINEQLAGGDTSAVVARGKAEATMLLGDKLPLVVDSLDKITDLNATDMNALLAVLSHILLGVLAKQKSVHGLGPHEITALVQDQRDELASGLPAGIGAILGLSDSSRADRLRAERSPNEAAAIDAIHATASTGAIISEAHQPETTSIMSSKTNSRGVLWKLLPIIGILILAIVAWRLFSPSNLPHDPEPFPDDEIEGIELPEDL